MDPMVVALCIAIRLAIVPSACQRYATAMDLIMVVQCINSPGLPNTVPRGLMSSDWDSNTA